MTATIRFTNQYNSDDVNKCIDDIELSGGEAMMRSYYQDDNYVEIIVNILDLTSFENLFKSTRSYPFSNY